MGRLRAVATWSATTILLLTCIGCGSSDSAPSTGAPLVTRHAWAGSTTYDAAFWRRAGRACRPFRIFDDAHPSVVPGMDPERPTRAQLAAVAAFNRRTHSPFAAHRVWTRIARRLGTPRVGVAAWRRIAADLRAYDAAHDAQLRSVRERDVRAWRRAYGQVSVVLNDLAGDVRGVAPPSNDCVRLFG